MFIEVKEIKNSQLTSWQGFKKTKQIRRTHKHRYYERTTSNVFALVHRLNQIGFGLVFSSTENSDVNKYTKNTTFNIESKCCKYTVSAGWTG